MRTESLYYQTVIIYHNDVEWFQTDANSIQGAIADLYDFVEGDITKELFRNIVTKISPLEALELFNSVGNDTPITKIFTGCTDEYIEGLKT